MFSCTDDTTDGFAEACNSYFSDFVETNAPIEGKNRVVRPNAHFCRRGTQQAKYTGWKAE